MAKKVVKTNAVRIVEQQKMPHEILSYAIKEGESVDGLTVSEKIGYSVTYVHKTLLATSGKNFYVFVIPVDKELDLKKAAKVVREKKIEMLAAKDLLGVTGYVRGGCSPIGMKKLFPTYIAETAQKLDFMIVSGGKIGLQVKLAPQDLAKIVQAQFADIVD